MTARTFGDAPAVPRLCECGCGRETKIAKKTEKGSVKGQPLRYIHGHTNGRPDSLAKTDRPCVQCGKPFRSKKPGRRFCSKSCAWKACIGPEKSREYLRKASEAYAERIRGSGKKAPYIKLGGRHLHRSVAEQKIGRPLLPGEIVHHIDGNSRNNNPDNLAVMTQGQHMKEHGLATPKLSAEDIPLIRSARAAGVQLAALGKAYGVAPQTIQAIVNGRSWKWVPNG